MIEQEQNVVQSDRWNLTVIKMVSLHSLTQSIILPTEMKISVLLYITVNEFNMTR